MLVGEGKLLRSWIKKWFVNMQDPVRIISMLSTIPLNIYKRAPFQNCLKMQPKLVLLSNAKLMCLIMIL